MYDTGEYTAHTQNVQRDIAHTHTHTVSVSLLQAVQQTACVSVQSSGEHVWLFPRCCPAEG